MAEGNGKFGGREVVIVEAVRTPVGLVTMCCGGGLGTGTLIERV